MALDVKTLLELAAYYPAEIDRVLDTKNPSFLQFDAELGYVLKDYIFRDGMLDTLSEYRYHSRGGHRKMINYADRPCRINTYGDSYTQCAQVSDGETWQEILAAHFREPIRNFGVGGYGVYQAYLRAMRTETMKDCSAEYIILNIWDDDHLRNLDAARWIRVAWMCKGLPRGGGEGTYPVHGFPWNHIRWDANREGFVELEGFCKKPEDLRKLVGKENYYNVFKDDHIVHLCVLREGGDAPTGELEKIAESMGIKVNLRDTVTRQADAVKLHWSYGMRATMYIIDKFMAWARQNGRKLMILLSYDAPQVRQYLEKGTRFDEEMVEYLNKSGLLWVDFLEKAKAEYKNYNLPVNAFLEKFYIGRAGAQVFGHYNPYGNFWFAYAMRNELVDWLNPKPPAYH